MLSELLVALNLFFILQKAAQTLSDFTWLVLCFNKINKTLLKLVDVDRQNIFLNVVLYNGAFTGFRQQTRF